MITKIASAALRLYDSDIQNISPELEKKVMKEYYRIQLCNVLCMMRPTSALPGGEDGPGEPARGGLAGLDG